MEPINKFFKMCVLDLVNSLSDVTNTKMYKVKLIISPFFSVLTIYVLPKGRLLFFFLFCFKSNPLISLFCVSIKKKKH